MPVDLIVRGGVVVRDDAVQPADIAVDDGVIVAIDSELAEPARNEIDARGLHVFPGMIDPHVHFNEPGRDDWEGIATGSAALSAGGGTCFFDMPLNSTPPLLDAQAFEHKLTAALARSVTDFAFWGGLTPINLDRMDELAACGVIGFKAFLCHSGLEEFPPADDCTLYRGMQQAARLKLPVAVHAENDAITAGLTRQIRSAGGRGMRDFAASRPVIAEVEAIRRAVVMARATGCSLHVVHVSSWQGCQELAAPRRESAGHFPRRWDITCETCPHYLLLDVEQAERIGPTAKCAPPVRDAENRFRLVELLAAGAFDFVGSDHSPAPPSMKASDDMFENWGGIAGVQSTLPALLSLNPPLALADIARLTAGHVAGRFGIARKGRIEVGFDADLALVSAEESFELRRDDLLDRHRQSPYVGRRFRGVIRQTLLRGQTVFAAGRVNPEIRGRLLRPVT